MDLYRYNLDRYQTKPEAALKLLSQGESPRDESLNPNLTVRLGNERPTGNPQMLNFDRFQEEFAVETIPLSDRLKKAAGK